MHRINLFLCLLLFGACAAAQTATPQPEIAIGVITLNTSSDTLSSGDRQKIIQDLQGRTYKSGNVHEIVQRARYELQERGFFKANVSRSSVVVVSETPRQEIVDIVLSVRTGEQYRLKDISFTGEKAFSAEELQVEFPLVDGDVFNVEKVRQGLDKLRKIYESKGYVNFTPVPNTQADDAAHTISLMVDVDEGAQFRIGRLVLDGVEVKLGAGEKLLRNWKQYEGQIYGPRIPEQFLRDNAALLPAGASWSNLAVTQEPQLHILNFRLDLLDPVDMNR